MRWSRFDVPYPCTDLRAAGIIVHCCVACHGWDDWSEKSAGLVEFKIGNGKRLICCCGYQDSHSNHWVLNKLQAHREDLRIERRPRRKKSRNWQKPPLRVLPFGGNITIRIQN